VTVAYYAASQMVAFTAQQFGFEGITRALRLWGEGKRTADVIQIAFGIPAKQYDSRFRAWALARLARYEGQYIFHLRPRSLDDAKAAAAAAPGNAPAHVDYAFSLLHAHKVDEASQEIDAALKIDPNDKDAHFLAAKVAVGTKDIDGAEKHVRAIRSGGGDGYDVESALAELAEGRKDSAAQRAALEAAHRFDPTQPDVVRQLYDLATEDKRDADALAALRELARLDQHDRLAWRKLLDALVEAKKWDEARRVGEAALYVDVESGGLHVGYARALAAGGDHAAAAFELESALLCEGKPEDKAMAHALLARERLALGDTTAAKVHRDEALRLDPKNAEASGLKL
jgi:tetratricopeptide (TPR) repeat protein